MRNIGKVLNGCLSGWVLVAAFLSAVGHAASGDLRLLEAVKQGDAETVRTLLQQRVDVVDVNEAQPDGATALAWAVHRNDLQTSGLLIRAGADVNRANDYGVAPLALACTNRNGEAVKILLEAGADPNAAQVTGETALMTCSKTGDVDGVRLLLDHGAQVNATEGQGAQTALMWAVAERHPRVVALLAGAGADVNALSNGSDGYTPLLYAANYQGESEAGSGSSGFSPLMFAAQQGDVESARILLDAGADVTESAPDYGNALVVAAASGHEEMALLMLERGADPNVADGNGITPLHYANRKGLSDLIGFQFEFEYEPYYRAPWVNMPGLVGPLLAAGADPNAQIKKSLTNFPSRAPHAARMDGATPFFLAAVSADIGLIRRLVENGADPLLEARGGTTPLMVAAGGVWKAYRSEEDKAAALEAVKLIVGLDADVNAANVGGETAMHAAAFTGADAIVEYLASKGADVNVEDMSGETPWTMAAGISPRPSRAGLYGNYESTAELLVRLGAKAFSPEEVDALMKRADSIANLQRCYAPPASLDDALDAPPNAVDASGGGRSR